MARAATASEPVQDTRERILVAALQAFSEMGFDGASTRAIAERAGVTLGLLQYHFGGKQKLWRAAVDRAFEQMRSGIVAVLDDASITDERERMRRVLREHVHFVARRPEFVRLMHDEGKRKGPRMRWLVDRHTRPLFERLAQTIEGLQARGALPADIAPIHFVYILIGATDLIFHQSEECKRIAGFDPHSDAAADAHVRAIEHLLFGPRRA